MKYNQLFIGGDLSGIQKFIYNVSSRQAAVSLKGRSFFLQRYMENVCERLTNVAKNAGATSVETIYCSGGKFYIISDYTPDIVNEINTFSLDIQKEIWKEHYGQLSIFISSEPFTENEDGSVNVRGKEHQAPGCLWAFVNNSFTKQKKQKFINVLSNDYNELFQPIHVGGKPKICAITGIESPDCIKKKFDNDSEEESYVLPSVYQQIQLGKELRTKQHFKTFEEYAGDSYLGVLRMDVDGLGQRFIKGFGSIKEYHTFSEHLVNFFGKRITQIQREDQFRDDLNIIYSGGDDLFVVGRWDKTIDFADRIRREVTSEFASDHITISGGMAVVKPKFPIAKAAEIAGEAEDAAKGFNHGEKNAFHFLGRTVSWDKEFDYVRKFMSQFTDLITHESMGKSILHQVMLYGAIADMNKARMRKNKPADYSYVWHLSYYLTRFIERYKNNKEICDFCRNLRNHELTGNNGRNLELLSLSARWAELVLKDNINN